jgi:superfamily I DNA and RNA helicase
MRHIPTNPMEWAQMELNATGKHLDADRAARDLTEILRSNEDELGLKEAQLYYDFPLYKDLDGTLVISKVLLVSPVHGVIAIGTSNVTSREDVSAELLSIENNQDEVFASLFARLIRNNSLRKSRTELLFPTEAVLFAPYIGEGPTNDLLKTPVFRTAKTLSDYLNRVRFFPPLNSDTFAELISTVEGSSGIIRPKPRDIPGEDKRSKGYLVSKLESSIASFDQRQKHGMMSVLDGPQRIRGLAGSGKTVVLAMKAAQTHLRFPEATILYTFHTRSLYQHIQRMITRFYRQFDDKDPDWDRLKIVHGWGGSNTPGVYYETCKRHGIEPMAYSEAMRHSSRDPFNFVCSELLKSATITPAFDYVFVDEGQDFPISFLQLCKKLARSSRLIFAYDELQTIFRTKAPAPSDFLDPGEELADDLILYKCYRNPREIIVCAHALGFGIYGSRIVQMLEDIEQWADIGYEVIEGKYIEGSKVVLERPAKNSLSIISDDQKPQEIVQGIVYDTFENEIQGTAKRIQSDIQNGLLPDDILVVVVDDRHASIYLSQLAAALAKLTISTNNIHADSYGLRDFQKEGSVTLSTVHKAKGNEAFMVYVIGVDALFSSYASVRERNMLFTAMTRAKGWVRVSGIGEHAAICKSEIDTALKNFPYLIFNYPSEKELKIMKRDLADRAIRKQKAERMLDRIMEELTPEEIESFINQRSISKGSD